ncbi:hypothetical protein MC7420_5107 [Coleofasciculus chthonoplastes PCC 7420]|uniref:Uncharacterized protein n=1 Tax=Coleofasciculus chthonoplastes PCC 7420 TaxID=118168 RepID=B4W1E7_9CYAN|nr:hypothetical protein MC7420_5107 [Coleofasciculus chthonoplastes PCC 7420]
MLSVLILIISTLNIEVESLSSDQSKFGTIVETRHGASLHK